MTTAARSRGGTARPLGSLADFARAFRLYGTTLQSPGVVVWFASAVLMSIGFTFATPDKGESANALLGAGALLFCLALSGGPLVLLRDGRAGALAFFETRPLRFPLKAVVLAPLYVLSALYAVIVDAVHHFGAAKAAAVAGACVWAVDVGMASPPRTFGRFLGWLALSIAGLLTFATARASGGWPAAAAAMGVLAVIGWIMIPRPVVGRYRASARDLVEQTDDPRWPAAARPAPVTPGASYTRRRRRTTWLDIVRTIAGGPHPVALPLMGVQMAIAGLMFAVVFSTRDATGGAFALWITATMSFAGPMASGLSRTSLEFLATRPIGRRRLISSTVVPWFVLTLSLPLAVLAWGPRGTVRFGAGRVAVASLALRLALTSVGCLFAFAHLSLRPRGARPSIVDFAPWAGFVAMALPLLFPYSSLRPPWPAPPLWVTVAYAVALGWALYRRLPSLLVDGRR